MSRHEVMLGRCDRCGAQPKQKITKKEMELLFCNHHFDAHAPALMAGGWSTQSLVSTEKKGAFT